MAHGNIEVTRGSKTRRNFSKSMTRTIVSLQNHRLTTHPGSASPGRSQGANKPALMAARGWRASVRMATPKEVRQLTGFAIGGVAPVGHATAIAVIMDERLSTFPTVWAAAGTPRSVFGIAPADLQRITGARVASVSRLQQDG